jgi:hypothetical protein
MYGATKRIFMLLDRFGEVQQNAVFKWESVSHDRAECRMCKVDVMSLI